MDDPKMSDRRAVYSASETPTDVPNRDVRWPNTTEEHERLNRAAERAFGMQTEGGWLLVCAALAYAEGAGLVPPSRDYATELEVEENRYVGGGGIGAPSLARLRHLVHMHKMGSLAREREE